MSTFTSLRPAISTVLATVSELQESHNTHKMSFGGYPAATFEPDSSENEAATSSDNIRRHVFSVVIHQEMEHAGRDTAVGILVAAVDAVITAFESDLTLGGASDFCAPLVGEFTEYTCGDGAIIAVEISIECISEIKVLA